MVLHLLSLTRSIAPLVQVGLYGLYLCGWGLEEPPLGKPLTRKLRRQQRTCLGLEVHLTLPSSSDSLVYRTSDISASGLFIETPTPFPVGTKLTVRIVLRAAEVTVGSEGRVVRTVLPGNGRSQTPGMGIQFVEDGNTGWQFVSRTGGETSDDRVKTTRVSR